MPKPDLRPELKGFKQVQLAALRKHGQHVCSVCEEPIHYQSRRWAFCAGCNEISHPHCLSAARPRYCFRCRPH